MFARKYIRFKTCVRTRLKGGRLSGLELRECLKRDGFRFFTSVGFYHTMAKLEDEGVVHGVNVPSVLQGYQINPRFYEITN